MVAGRRAGRLVVALHHFLEVPDSQSPSFGVRSPLQARRLGLPRSSLQSECADPYFADPIAIGSVAPALRGSRHRSFERDRDGGRQMKTLICGSVAATALALS